jgi:hypothetical protein
MAPGMSARARVRASARLASSRRVLKASKVGPMASRSAPSCFQRAEMKTRSAPKRPAAGTWEAAARTVAVKSVSFMKVTMTPIPDKRKRKSH